MLALVCKLVTCKTLDEVDLEAVVRLPRGHAVIHLESADDSGDCYPRHAITSKQPQLRRRSRPLKTVK